MEPIRLGMIAEIVDGQLMDGSPELPVSGISKDSRTIGKDELYVAIRGEHFDGHDFVAAAGKRGAVGSLVDHRLSSGLPEIVVADSIRALQILATWYRSRFSPTTIGITGSHGKTTCKEILAAILARHYSVHKTPANFNGQIGLPFALFGLERIHDYLILEMGISELGEMDKLVSMGKPSWGVFLNVAPVHTEFFGDLETIVHEKGKLLLHLLEPRVSFINGDDPRVRSFAENLHGRVVTFGIDTPCSIMARDFQLDDGGSNFTLECKQFQAAMRIPMLGRHHVYNALAALAVAVELGIDAEEMATALRRFEPMPMRMEVIERNGIRLINDAYNAAPASMKAALDVLRKLPAAGRRIAVLGDMLELGTRAREDHEQIGAYVAELGIDFLFTYGPLSQHVAASALTEHMQRTRVFHSSSQQELAQWITAIIQPGDLVLFKGSRGMKMERLMTLCFPLS